MRAYLKTSEFTVGQVIISVRVVLLVICCSVTLVDRRDLAAMVVVACSCWLPLPRPPRVTQPALVRAQPVAEAVAACLLMMPLEPLQRSMLPYLIAPALAAGLRSGFATAVIASGLATADPAARPTCSASRTRCLAHATSPTSATWTLITLAVGLLGGWVRRLQAAPGPPENAAYAAAYRLISQLRLVVPPALRRSRPSHPVRGPAREPAAGGAVRPGRGLRAGVRRPALARSRPRARTGWTGTSTSPLFDEAWASSAPVRPGPAAVPADSRLLGRGARCRSACAPSAWWPSSGPRSRLRPGRAGRRRRRARGAGAAARDRAAVQRGAHPGHRRGAPPAGPRDPRRHRPGARVARLRRRRPGRASPLPARPRGRPARRCAASSPGSSPSCGCRSSTCAARCRPPPGSAPPCPTTCGRSASGSNLTVHLVLDESPTRLPVDAETELLRIAQEAITNARKHANAQNLWVTCRVDPPRATLRDRGRRRRARQAAGRQLRPRGHARAGRAHRRAARPSRTGTTGGTTVEVTLGGPTTRRVGWPPCPSPSSSSTTTS